VQRDGGGGRYKSGAVCRAEPVTKLTVVHPGVVDCRPSYPYGVGGEHAEETCWLLAPPVRHVPACEGSVGYAMQVVSARCCGLDVQQKSVVACVLLTAQDGQVRREVRSFGTMTADLLAPERLAQPARPRAIGSTCSASSRGHGRVRASLGARSSICWKLIILLEADHPAGS
jgi:hypothetical protein